MPSQRGMALLMLCVAHAAGFLTPVSLFPSHHRASSPLLSSPLSHPLSSPSSFAKRTFLTTPASSSRRTAPSLLSLEAQDKKVLIVGAGPAGLLSAHYLLKRGGYEVSVVEKRGDPREGFTPSIRSYSLGLGVRGRGAIKGVSEDLWEKVMRGGVMSQRFCLHFGASAFP